MELKNRPAKTTYAQERLLNIIEKRQLRRLCIDNGIEGLHPRLYLIATGRYNPTYANMCQTCNIIPPVEWLFFTDEKLPWEAKTMPAFDFENKICRFVTLHIRDYLDIGEKYGLNKNVAYDTFINRVRHPSYTMIYNARYDVDPAEFFIEAEPVKVLSKGDVLSFQEHSEFVVLSNEESNKNSDSCIIGCETENGLILKTVGLPSATLQFSGKTDVEKAEKMLLKMKEMTK